MQFRQSIVRFAFFAALVVAPALSGCASDSSGAHVFARRDNGTNIVSRLVPDGTDVATLKAVSTNIALALELKLDKSGGTVTGDLSVGTTVKTDVVASYDFSYVPPDVSEDFYYVNAHSQGEYDYPCRYWPSSNTRGTLEVLGSDYSTVYLGTVDLGEIFEIEGREWRVVSEGNVYKIQHVETTTSPALNVHDGAVSFGDTPTVDGKAVALAASPSTPGNLAALDADGNLTDSGIPKTNVVTTGALSGKTMPANPSDTELRAAVSNIWEALGGSFR